MFEIEALVLRMVESEKLVLWRSERCILMDRLVVRRRGLKMAIRGYSQLVSEDQV